jgi:hypothetical protein
MKKEENQNKIISCELMEIWFEHLEKYKPDEVYSEIPTDDTLKYFQTRQIVKKTLTKKQRLNLLNFYIEGYSLLNSISIEQVKIMNYEEVKDYVDNFRRDIE